MPLPNHTSKSLIYHSIFSPDGLIPMIEANYDLTSPIECSLLARGVNEIYSVTSGGQQYILRLSRQSRYGTFDEEAYRFELDLLGFWREHALPISYPVSRRDRDTLGAINAPEGKRYYALFSFAEGKIPSSLEKGQSYVLGETLAKLHLAANSFSSPHARFHLDEDFLIDEPIRRLGRLPQITKGDFEILEKLSGTLRHSIQSLARQQDKYGIIHGDFWWNNAHFIGNKATVFDFDFCGYGWRVYDIGSLRGTAKAFGYNLEDGVIDAFMQGYQSIRKLTETELAAIAAFEKIRVIWLFGIWTSFMDEFGTRWFYSTFNETLSNLKKWIEEESVQV